jgi:hypothetical protein
MDRRLVSAWWTLKIALGSVAVLVGVDKFVNVLTSWSDYLNPVALEYVAVDAEVLVRAAGIVEMIVGIAILTRWTRLGAYLAALWFVIMAANLISMQKFYDVAVLDLLLAASAFALAQITAVRQEEMSEVEAPQWEPAPREILTLRL